MIRAINLALFLALFVGGVGGAFWFESHTARLEHAMARIDALVLEKRQIESELAAAMSENSDLRRQLSRYEDGARRLLQHSRNPDQADGDASPSDEEPRIIQPIPQLLPDAPPVPDVP
ncbi:MAG: hypothetical protein ABID63_12710 [Pseudomonadota bacterium]